MSSTFGKWGEDTGAGAEVACTVGHGGRGVLENQEGQLRRGQRTGPRSSSFISRQERVLCCGGQGSHRTAKRSFSSPRVEDGRKGGELAAQGDPVWPPKGLAEIEQRPQIRHCFGKPDPPMARHHAHAL